MKESTMFKTLPIVTGLCFAVSGAFAQTAAISDNITSTRQATIAVISAAPVLEFSNSMQEDIVSYFTQNSWIQATRSGEKLGENRIQVKRDGRVCFAGTNNCFQVERVSDGWYMVRPESGERSDEKHMRYVGTN